MSDFDTPSFQRAIQLVIEAEGGCNLPIGAGISLDSLLSDKIIVIDFRTK
jgi:hypothetical protein